MKEVSLVTMFYNEAFYLPKFLEEIRDIFYDCIFVDGGQDGSSTDGSIEMIEREGHKVYHFENFVYDLAKVKNFGLDQCKTKWRLVLDTDEYMSIGMKEFIKNFDKNMSSSYCFSFFRDNYLDGSLQDNAPLDFPIRLTSQEARYYSNTNTVHERIITSRGVMERKFVGGRLFHKKDSYRQARNNLINEVVLRGGIRIPDNKGAFWDGEKGKLRMVNLLPGRVIGWIDEYMDGPYKNI